MLVIDDSTFKFVAYFANKQPLSRGSVECVLHFQDGRKNSHLGPPCYSDVIHLCHLENFKGAHRHEIRQQEALLHYNRTSYLATKELKLVFSVFFF